jgi:uncharacterized membrane protein YfbV (UPF0208 family)
VPSITDTWVTVMPETRKLAEGIKKAFRELDSTAREAGQRWGREIERGIGEAKVELKADTGRARAEIDAAAKDRHSTIHVDVDKDRLGQVGSTVSNAITNSVEDGMSDLGPKLSGSAASAGGSIGSAMGGPMTAALIAAGATAIAGVASSLSGIAGLLPAGLLGAGGVVGTLAVGLDGVKDAYDAVTKASETSGQEQASKAKEVESAQRTLTDAVQSQAQAQRDVAGAYRDARQNLDDLNLSLQGGKISEAQAYNNVLKARRDLAQGHFKDTLEYNDAVLRVQSAEQSWRESQQRNVELQAKTNDANAKGVENSDAVVAAKERERRANESVQAAQENVNTIQTKLSSTAQDAALSMSKLSPQAQAFVNTLVGMKPAFQDFKNSVQDALFGNIGPQFQQLATTYMPVLQSLMTNLGTSMNHAFGELSKFLQQPQTLAAVQSIFANIGSSFQVWMQALKPASEAFLRFTQVGSSFLPQLAQMGIGLANMFNQFAQSGQLQQWMQTGMNALGQLMNMLPTVLQMFADLAPIGGAVLGAIGSALTALAPAIGPLAGLFASWVNAMSPGLNLLIQIGTTIFNALAPAFQQWFTAMAPVAQQLANALTPVLQTLGPVLAQVANQIGGALIGAVQQLLPLVIPLVKAIAGWYTTMLPLLPQLFQLGTTLLPVIVQAVSLVIPPFTKFLEILTGLAKEVIPAIQTGLTAFSTAFTTAFNAVKSVVETVWNFIKPIFDHIEQFLANIPGPLKTLIGLDSQGGQGGTVLRAPVAPSSAGTTGLPGISMPGVPGWLQSGPVGWDGKPLPAATSGYSADWNKIAGAESGGNWQINTGNGFFGGLQFDQPTWDQYKPPGAPARADMATKEQQIAAGEARKKAGAETGWPATYAAHPEWFQSGGASAMPTMPGSYGLPAGTNSGGYGGSGAQFPDWVNQIAQQFGIKPSTYPGHQETDRHEAGYAPNPNHENRAIDWSGPVENMQKFAEYLKTIPGSLEQVIWKNPQTGQEIGVGGGKDVSGGYYSQTGEGSYQEHDNHVHTRQSAPIPLPGGIYGGPGMSGTVGPAGTQDDPMYVQLPADAMQKDSTGGGQLGQDLLGGILQEFGMDGSVFKDPTQFGLFKLFKGVMGLKPKDGGGAGSDGSISGGGGGMSGLLSLIPGISHQPFGPLQSGSPGSAPGEFMPLMPGSSGGVNFPQIAAGAPGAAGPGNVDNSINISGVENPGPAFDAANQANVPRMRQQLRPLPG